MKQQYVAGFLFNEDRSKVVLVEKRKFPKGLDWSANPHNAVGGKVEQDESLHTAMVREFEEETGLRVAYWNHFLSLELTYGTVHFFRAISEQQHLVRTIEAEPIVIRDARDTAACIPNLRWILPLALDNDHQGVALAQSR